MFDREFLSDVSRSIIAMEQCPKCGKNKSTGTASLTQWILVCSCDDLKGQGKTEDPPVQPICMTCGLLISDNKSGTLTQWIFTSHRCKCANPNLISNPEPGEPGEPGEKNAASELPAGFPKERYEPLSKAGQGSMGLIYHCHDRLLKREVAIKILRSLAPEQLIAFQREARATKHLRHPNIVSIIDFGIIDGITPYMVLDYFAGVSLKSLIDEGSLLPVETVLDLAMQTCDALAYAHQKGLFHRDITSANILVCRQVNETQGEGNERISVKLIDFGIAIGKGTTDDPSLFMGKTLAGTPAYMAPDLPQGRDYDERSEVYSLGCVLFEALTGKLPFVGETSLDVLNQHAREPAPSILEVTGQALPQSIETLIAKCLAKDPDERFQNMDELKAALEEIAIARADYEPTEPTVALPVETSLPTWSVFIAALLTVLIVTAYCIIFGTSKAKVEVPLHEDLAEKKSLPPEDALSPFRSEPDKASITMDMGQLTLHNPDDALFDEIDPDCKKLAIVDGSYTGAGLKKLARLPLSSLTITGCPLTDKDLGVLKEIKTLKYLGLHFCKGLSGDFMKYLADTRISALFMKGAYSFDENKLLHLQTCKNLASLTLELCPTISDRGIQFLGGCGLASLELKELDRVHDSSFSTFGSAKALRSLTLISCRKVRGDTLGNIKEPVSVTLNEVPFSAACLSGLLKKQSLSSLSLIDAGQVAAATAATDDPIQLYAPGESVPYRYPPGSFRELPGSHLSELSLNYDLLSPDDFQYLCQARQLTSLRIFASSPIPPSRIASLSALSNLRELCLYWRCIDRLGWREIERFSHLQKLRAVRTNLSNDDIASIAHLPLETLSINESRLTSKGLSTLAKMTTLRQFEYENSPGISVSALKMLRKALPHCTINSASIY